MADLLEENDLCLHKFYQAILIVETNTEAKNIAEVRV